MVRRGVAVEKLAQREFSEIASRQEAQQTIFPSLLGIFYHPIFDFFRENRLFQQTQDFATVILARSFREAHYDSIASMQWAPIRWSRLLKLMLLGAVGFWLPDTLLHALRGNNFTGRDVGIVTVVSPLTLLMTFFLAKWTDKAAPRKQVGPPLLAGVWLFGGFFMLVGASFSGGGLMSPDGARFSVTTILLSIIPLYTFIMATYDGALMALLLVTVVILLGWLFHRSDSLLRSSC